MTRRYVDWYQRFMAAVEQRRRTPFAYGHHDCSLGACDLALAICDCPDPGDPWRGKYKSERGAIGALRRYLGADRAMRYDDLLFAAAVKRAAEIGFGRWEDPIYAQRGDIVFVRLDSLPSIDRVDPKLIAGDRHFALGTVALNGREILVPGEAGYVALPQRAATAAWSVN